MLANQTEYFGPGIQAWVEFFTYWGTGQPTKLLLGGTGAILFGLAEGVFSQQGSAWAEGQAAADVGWFAYQAGGSVNGKVGEASALFTSSIVYETLWLGGICDPGQSGCSFADWSESLFTYPQPLQFEGVPQLIVMVTLEQAATDAVNNISTVAMLKTLVLPLALDVTNKISQMSWQDPTPCTATNSEPRFDNGLDNAVCCTSSYTGSAYPSAATWQTWNATALQVSAAAASLVANVTVFIAGSWLSQQQLFDVLALVPTLAAFNVGSMSTAS